MTAPSAQPPRDDGATPSVAASRARPSLDVERGLWRRGHRWVAGIDEVGRGAWAGPLSVGVAVVHPGARRASLPRMLRDSKALTEARREDVFADVARWCADAAVGHASAEECDRWGMTLAWRLAACRALARLEVRPDAVVLDGPHDLLTARGEDRARGGEPFGPPVPDVPVPTTVVTVVGGDARCASVAAASILAKVVRDRAMREEAVHFPAYGFERNKGYPSAHHQIALRGYGLSAIHRRSWAFVAGLPWS